MKRRSAALFAEQLEDRCTPSTSGVGWGFADHLTLSFAPDGTQVGDQQSNLFQLLNAIAPTTVWETEILRAVQTWAANVNMNVAVVPDNGAPFGTAGAVQGDARFGDIRIAAVPLPANTVATNTGFQWSGSTNSGDIVLNSNDVFSVGGSNGTYDLYSIALHESGDALGLLDQTTDRHSAQYATYIGPRTGLSPADVSDIESLYGSRNLDPYEQGQANNSFATATALPGPATGPSAMSDIANSNDADCFSFTVPASTFPVQSATVALTTSGLSSLQGTLTVFDSAHNVVGSAAANSPLNGNLVVTIANPLAGAQYYIAVAANTASVFGTGSYQLGASYQYANGTTSGPAAPSADATVNYYASALALGTTATPAQVAAQLTNPPLLLGLGGALVLPGWTMNVPTSNRLDYLHEGNIVQPTQVDAYDVKAPTNQPGPVKLDVLVYAANHSNLNPQIQVFDANNNPVAATVLANGNGAYSVEIANVQQGADYQIKVSPLNAVGLNATGQYFLRAEFSTLPAPVFQEITGGNAPTLGQPQTGTLQVLQNEMFEFMLAVNNYSGDLLSSVQMTILNANGQVVFTMTSYGGQPPTTAYVYLPAGTYTVEFTGFSLLDSSVPFTLYGAVESQPIGPQPTNSSGSGSGSGGSTSNSGSTPGATPPSNSGPTYYYH
jgi:hypothetical protein